MRRVFGAKKNTEPPPSIQDASDRVWFLIILSLFFDFNWGIYSSNRLCGGFAIGAAVLKFHFGFIEILIENQSLGELEPLSSKSRRKN